tara:strand:- start:117 stop:584 length:468 start_codon:yes stop_codon:yes gene_type:complete
MNFLRINDFPNYVIHPCGTILKIWKKHTRELKHSKMSDGYMRIGLSKNGKVKGFYVHRLLSIAFIPNSENKRCVDHINGIKDDNRLENLRWLTHKENSNAFRSNPAQLITKGGISKKGNGWEWQYYISGKRKTKNMKSKEDLEKYRKEKITEYNI